MASNITYFTNKNIQHLQKIASNGNFDLEGTSYSLLEIIGSGSYGIVCSAMNSFTSQKVAIKKITNAFQVQTIAKRTFREIKILRHFHHDNVIAIRDILLPQKGDLNDIYLIQDLMQSDLHQIIYSEQNLSEEHVRYFLYQIFRGLKYIHSANIIHRDLKPNNLLVNANCDLKIGDFGMARNISSTSEQHKCFMTQYVATRWYRAPELMLSLLEYTAGVDIWSVGCIFAEMCGRKQLFPGKNYIHQLKLILHHLGTPSDSLLKSCQSDIVRNFIKGLGYYYPIPWHSHFPNLSSNAINLLHQMLRFDPSERCSAIEAINHPYLHKYHDPDDEPVCIPAFNFDFDRSDYTCDQLKSLVLQEILDFNQKLEQVRLILENSHLSSVGLAIEKPTSNNLNYTSSGISKVNQHIQNQSDESFTSVNYLSPMQIQKKNVLNKKKCVKGTISMNTRALVKAALLSGSLGKKKMDNVNIKNNIKKVHVTALSRQREREEKRRRKLLRAKEKERKLQAKFKNNETEILSEEDQQLLARWKQMQEEPFKKLSGLSVNSNALLSDKECNLKIENSNFTSSESLVSNYFISSDIKASYMGSNCSSLSFKTTAKVNSAYALPFQITPDHIINSKFQTHSEIIVCQSSEEMNDCVSLLGKHFSKSQMDDDLTIALPVSPVNRGAGYGIGKEIEDIIKDSLPSVQGAELSHCDSPSLFADLLEATSLKPHDLEALQKELELGSPMIFSD